MIQIWERCKPLQLISPVNTDHAMFIWKSKTDLPFSKKLSRYQNSERLLSLNVIALSNSYMYIKSLQVWHGLESLFWKNYFYIKLLIVMCIWVCDVQYWKSNNICNTWKIKEKLQILMTCDDLSFINNMQKTLKPSKKRFNSQDGWENNSYQGISAERYWRKHEMQVASKKVYWKNNRMFQTFATYHHSKRYFFRT